MTKIINAIQSGDTVILENIGESLDASLDSVLTKVSIPCYPKLSHFKRIFLGSLSKRENSVLEDWGGGCRVRRAFQTVPADQAFQSALQT